MRAHRTAVSALALSLLAGSAAAQVTPGAIGVDLAPVANGMVAPIVGVPANDGSNRFFVVDQTGKVFIILNGTILPQPFLDLTSEIVTVNTSFDERGLLGLAFHPDYENNGRFFVRYSKARDGLPTEPCFGTSRGCHEEILAEYRVSNTDPNAADPASGHILFRVNKPEFNHNSGDVVFGPDGYLYFTLGDGGGANDGLHLPSLPHGPIGNGQNINVPLGKVLRIDVDVPNGSGYSIPPDNPFANTEGLDEIFAWGLRNPYRFSFDMTPGGIPVMYLTDVGQNLLEELNVGQLGANYGWVIMEGANCFDPFNPGTPLPNCNQTGLTLPIAVYGRTVGISIIGGYVYRGPTVPQIVGKYVFGDFSTAFGSPDGHLFYLDPATPSSIRRLRIGADDRALNKFVKGFGRDEQGEIYVMVGSTGGPSGTSGQVLKMVSCYANCDGSAVPPALNVADFTCFLSNYAAGKASANCDLSTAAPVLNVADFTCFLQRFAAGCP
jgi:glucose/arabinose dehydrogenase